MSIAWAALATAGAAAAATGPAYFPDALTEPRLICDATRPAERAPVLTAHDAGRYSAFLAAAGEPILAPGGARIEGEVLRFVWLRSFDAPIIIRVERRGKAAHLVAVRLTGQSSRAAGRIAQRVERDLAGDELARLRAAITDSDLDQLPPGHCRRGTAEGSVVWLFEHADRKSYHFVERRTAEAGPVRPLGMLLLGLAGWSGEQSY